MAAKTVDRTKKGKRKIPFIFSGKAASIFRVEAKAENEEVKKYRNSKETQISLKVSFS
ncbi:hypothetical protein PanWU01x14_299890, partial [Parasponia andersonii]